MERRRSVVPVVDVQQLLCCYGTDTWTDARLGRVFTLCEARRRGVLGCNRTLRVARRTLDGVPRKLVDSVFPSVLIPSFRPSSVLLPSLIPPSALPSLFPSSKFPHSVTLPPEQIC